MYQIYMFIPYIRDIQYEYITKTPILHTGDAQNSGFSYNNVIPMEKSEKIIGTLQRARHLLIISMRVSYLKQDWNKL